MKIEDSQDKNIVLKMNFGIKTIIEPVIKPIIKPIIKPGIEK